MVLEENELEKEFEKLCEEFKTTLEPYKKEIDLKLKEASEALDEAVKLSEKYAVPFHTGISFLDNTYMPKSFKNSKFKDVPAEILEDITGVYNEDGDHYYAGWTTSAVC